MSSKLKLDVCCLSGCGGAIWWTLTNERQAWCCLQAKQRDPCLSALCVKKGKGFPYSIPSVGPGADPGVQAVSLQVTVSHPPGDRLPLLSARPAVTSPAGTKLYCLVTEAHRCKQLAWGCYTALSWAGFETATYWSQAQMPYRCTTAPPTLCVPWCK